MNTEDFSSLANDLFESSVLVHKKVFNHEEILKSFHIPPSHVKVLFHLTHMGPNSISQVAQMLSISKPNMTPIIDNLLKEGYVKRYEDEKDRRVLIIEASEKAFQLFKEKKQELKDRLAIKLEDLTPEELTNLSCCLKNLSTILSKID